MPLLQAGGPLKPGRGHSRFTSTWSFAGSSTWMPLTSGALKSRACELQPWLYRSQSPPEMKDGYRSASPANEMPSPYSMSHATFHISFAYTCLLVAHRESESSDRPSQESSEAVTKLTDRISAILAHDRHRSVTADSPYRPIRPLMPSKFRTESRIPPVNQPDFGM